MIYLADFVPPPRSVLLDVDNYHFFRFTSPFPTLHKHPEVAAFLPLDTWLHVSARPRSSVNLTHWLLLPDLILRNHSGFYSSKAGKRLLSKCDIINGSICTVIRVDFASISLISGLYFISKYILLTVLGCHV